MIERRIKELAIALEALSRVNTPEGSEIYSDLVELMNKTIKEAQAQFPKPKTFTDLAQSFTANTDPQDNYHIENEGNI